MTEVAGRRVRTAALVLPILAMGQFVMALDTTGLNTAIATVARDPGTTVTGIQTAITLCTLVMASLMITVRSRLGRGPGPRGCVLHTGGPT